MNFYSELEDVGKIKYHNIFDQMAQMTIGAFIKY